MKFYKLIIDDNEEVISLDKWLIELYIVQRNGAAFRLPYFVRLCYKAAYASGEFHILLLQIDRFNAFNRHLDLIVVFHIPRKRPQIGFAILRRSKENYIFIPCSSIVSLTAYIYPIILPSLHGRKIYMIPDTIRFYSDFFRNRWIRNGQYFVNIFFY